MIVENFLNMYLENQKSVPITDRKYQRNNNSHISSAMDTHLSYSGDVQQGSLISIFSPLAPPFTTFNHTPNIQMKEREALYPKKWLQICILDLPLFPLRSLKLASDGPYCLEPIPFYT